MNPHKFDAISKLLEKALGWLIIGCIVVFLIALTSCTYCPAGQDSLCPTFPNAAPRQ